MIDIDNWNNIINESAIRGYEEELEKKDILLRDKNKEIERLNNIINRIEEDKKIEKLEIISSDSGTMYECIANKINEIIDYINKENK